MDKARWQYLKQLRPHPGRFAFVSAEAEMRRNPLDTAQANEWPTLPLIPWIEKPGRTFCQNNNARKEAIREHKARGFA